jgi:hypothetical protein
MIDSTNTIISSPGPTPQFRDAYERVLDEITKVPDAELITINFDIPTAVTTGLGALP